MAADRRSSLRRHIACSGLLLLTAMASSVARAQDNDPVIWNDGDTTGFILIDDTGAEQDLRDALLIDSMGATAQQAPAPLRPDLPDVDLQQRLKDVTVTSTPQGDIVRVETEAGPVDLTAAEYVRALGASKARLESHGFFYRILNISRPWSFIWISIGFLGQAMFTFRMVLQWLASEKHKRSVVPVGFWWGSLIGGGMLFAYFCWRKDVVGIIGQSTGVFIYARNLVLIYRGKAVEAQGTRPRDEARATPRPT